MSEKNTEELVSTDEVTETSHWTINIPKPNFKISPKKIAVGVGIAAATTLGVIFLGKHYDNGFEDDWSDETSESSEDDIFESSEDTSSED